MNVSCPSCPAKYLVPDAKIRGRRLRMVCKRCGTPFVVDGTEAPSELADGAERAAPADWIVMVNDRDATQMSSRHLVELYALGAVHARTRVWRAETQECGSPFDFPELAALLAARGLRPETEVALAASLVDYPQDDDATVVGYPTLQARFPEGASGRRAPSDAYDDQTTVAVARSSALAESLRHEWAPEGLDGANERTVSGDVRALAAGAAEFEDDDDPELGVARLPAHLVDHPEFASILIAPNSGEEPAAALTPSRSPAGAERGPPSADRGSVVAGRARRRPARSEPRPPTPAAGAPAKANEVPRSRRERASTVPPDPAARPSHPPSPGAAGGARHSSPSLHPLLVTNEPRIPPPPAVIPPPPVGPGGAPVEDLEVPVERGSLAPDAPELDELGRDFPPELRPRRWRLWPWLRALLLLLLLAGAAIAGVYAYDRELLVAALPELPQLLPELFPAPVVEPPPPTPPPSPPPPPSASTEPVDAGLEDAAAQEVPPDAALFDRKSAVAALAVTAEAAKVCFDPAARIYGGMVIVTFAPSGRPTKVDLHGRLPGTAVGDCVARAFERVKIEPFRGEPVPVGHSLALP